jgi:hypothetical protein
MSAFVEDFGSEHPQTKQVRILVTGLPGIPPLVITPVESSEITEATDTYDTKDGEAHSAGPNSASMEFTFSVYESDLAIRTALESWFKLRGASVAKVPVVVEYPYSDGSKGAGFRLHRAWCTSRKINGSGTAGAATTTYTLRYKRATRI